MTMNNFWIMAQADANQTVSRVTSEPVTTELRTSTTTQEPTAPVDTPKPSGLPPYMSLLLLVVMFVLMYMMLFRGPKKQQQQHRQMIQKLKKNDRVRTIGGILGTVVEVREDDVVLKIDENNNTKIHCATSAIGKNLSTEKE